jgi:hypothetical protein
VSKLIKDVLANPAFPLFWGKNQKGMQAEEELSGMELAEAKAVWHLAMNNAIGAARALIALGAHKQLVNRLLKPFSHITVVVTGTQWSNFFALRRHADAEPHIKMLPHRMFDAMEATTPSLLRPGQWHLPFVELDEIDEREQYRVKTTDALKLLAARCASTSYKTVDGFDMTV